MEMVRRALLSVGLLGLLTGNVTAKPSMPDFGGVEVAPAEATGFGVTRQAAILHALNLTLQQTNGIKVTSESQSTQGDLTLNAGSAGEIDVSSEAFADRIRSDSSGAIRSFEVLSADRISRTVAERETRATYRELDGEAHRSADLNVSGKATEFVWRARVRAQVLVYRAPEDTRPTVTVVGPRVQAESYRVVDVRIRADELGERLRGAIQSRLASTDRFVMADRSLTSALDEEVEFIHSGRARIEDSARIGQQAAADLILVVTVNEFAYARHERELRMNDRTLVSYSGRAEARTDLLNATTGLSVFSDIVEVIPPSIEPTTLAPAVESSRIMSEMLDELATSISDTVVHELFPVSVVAIQGTRVVLSQGGDSVDEGAWYELVFLGQEMTDPQTGLSLGRSERPCCVVRIERVEQNASYGMLTTPLPQQQSFKPGNLELRRQVRAPDTEEETETRIPAEGGNEEDDDWSQFEDMAQPDDEDW